MDTCDLRNQNQSAFITPIANETTTGGIKAVSKTAEDTVEVKVDAATGKGYVKPTSISIANETTTGGIKASAKTEEDTVEVKVDPNTGKGYVKPGLTGVPIANETTTGGIKAVDKTAEDTVEVKVDATTGKGYIKPVVVTDTTGESETDTMSQKAITTEINKLISKDLVYTSSEAASGISLPDNTDVSIDGTVEGLIINDVTGSGGLQFIAGTNTVFTFPANAGWGGGITPTFAEGKLYIVIWYKGSFLAVQGRGD